MSAHCDTLIEPACAAVSSVISSAASSVAGDVLSGLAGAISDGVRWIIVNTASFWVTIPSPDLTSQSAVTQLQAWMLPITAAVAVGALIAAGARMTIARKANPLLDVTGGLLTLAAATTMGILVPALLLKAGDAWSSWILQVSTGGQFTQRLSNVLVLGGQAASAVVLIFRIIAIVLSLVQAVLMLFRQAALVILAGVLPLAAAGSIAPLTRPWIRKITSWMLALICYKPAAAAVYAAAFTMIGSGSGARTVLTGFVMLVLSVIALPALMKFFTWTTGAVAGSGGGQLLGAAAVGAIAVGTMRSSGGASGPAQDQAAYLSTRLGSPPAGTPSGASRSPAGQPAPPQGPAASSSASSLASGAAASTSGPPASAGTATGAGAGPAGAAAAAAAQAASAAARQAGNAMGPEDSR